MALLATLEGLNLAVGQLWVLRVRGIQRVRKVDAVGTRAVSLLGHIWGREDTWASIWLRAGAGV